VFATRIDPDRMANWYAPSDEFGPTFGEVDPQVGGRYRIGMLSSGQAEPRFVSGQYCRLDAPRTLSFTWAWEPYKPGTRETQATLEFQPVGAGTNLALTHKRFRDESDRDGHCPGGWRGCLDRRGRKFGG
jgi:uncharacterized protein YndB with AHSA1/START domain